MSTLTDRYVWAVVRLLPEGQRTEIDRELHELVAETIDARRDAGDGRDPHVVEREALVQLGDPGRLAARYVDRPRALVGPELFPEYVRVLKLVWLVAVPLVTVLGVLGAALGDDPSVGHVLGTAAVAMYGSTVMVAFWVTLVYAFPEKWKHATPWSPDDLPDLPSSVATGRSLSIGDTVIGIVVTVFAAMALVWQHVWPPLDDDRGAGVPVLDPDIWHGAGQALLVLLGASLVVQMIVLVRRRWSYPLAGVNAAVNLASLGIVAWLALDEGFLNARFLEVLTERAGWDEVPTVDPWIVILLIGGVDAWDTVEAFVSARREAARRRAAAQQPDAGLTRRVTVAP